MERSLPLVGSQPILDAHGMFLNAFDPPDSGRKIGAQKSAVGSLVCKPANGGEAQVDSGGGIVSLFEANPIARHHGLVESKAGFRTVPVNESRIA